MPGMNQNGGAFARAGEQDGWHLEGARHYEVGRIADGAVARAELCRELITAFLDPLAVVRDIIVAGAGTFAAEAAQALHRMAFDETGVASVGARLAAIGVQAQPLQMKFPAVAEDRHDRCSR